MSEGAIGYVGPAVLANRFTVAIGPAGARLAFLEHDPATGNHFFRSAICMTLEDVDGLANLIQQLRRQQIDDLQKGFLASIPVKPDERAN